MSKIKGDQLKEFHDLCVSMKTAMTVYVPSTPEFKQISSPYFLNAYTLYRLGDEVMVPSDVKEGSKEKAARLEIYRKFLEPRYKKENSWKGHEKQFGQMLLSTGLFKSLKSADKEKEAFHYYTELGNHVINQVVKVSKEDKKVFKNIFRPKDASDNGIEIFKAAVGLCIAMTWDQIKSTAKADYSKDGIIAATTKLLDFNYIVDNFPQISPEVVGPCKIPMNTLPIVTKDHQYLCEQYDVIFKDAVMAKIQAILQSGGSVDAKDEMFKKVPGLCDIIFDDVEIQKVLLQATCYSIYFREKKELPKKLEDAANFSPVSFISGRVPRQKQDLLLRDFTQDEAIIDLLNSIMPLLRNLPDAYKKLPENSAALRERLCRRNDLNMINLII